MRLRQHSDSTLTPSRSDRLFQLASHFTRGPTAIDDRQVALPDLFFQDAGRIVVEKIGTENHQLGLLRDGVFAGPAITTPRSCPWKKSISCLVTLHDSVDSWPADTIQWPARNTSSGPFILRRLLADSRHGTQPFRSASGSCSGFFHEGMGTSPAVLFTREALLHYCARRNPRSRG